MANGIGRTKGGRNTKLHAVCDDKGRPLVLILTPGNTHDCKVAQQCIEALPPSAELVADKGYDSQALREWQPKKPSKPLTPEQSLVAAKKRQVDVAKQALQSVKDHQKQRKEQERMRNAT